LLKTLPKSYILSKIILCSKINIKPGNTLFKYLIFSLIAIFILPAILFTQEEINVDEEDYGDRLRIGYVWKGDFSFYPLKISTDYEKEYTNLVYGEGIFTINDSGYSVNNLALTSTLQNTNSRFVLRILLRPNLTFHDGSIITANDVKLSYELYKKFSLQSHLLYNARLIDRFEVWGEDIVRIFFKSQPTHFSETIGLLPILPESISTKLITYNSIDDIPFIIPFGFGKFQFSEYIPKEYIKLDSDKKHTFGQSYLSGIDFLFYESQERLLEAFLKEEIDLIQINDKSEVQKINQFSKKIIQIENGTKNLYYINFNTKKVPFNIIRIRRAINYAINKEQITDNLFNNYGKVSQFNFNNSSFNGSEYFTPFEYKPLDAIQILYDIQFKKNSQGKLVRNNKELQFELYIQKGSLFEESIARIIAINLGDIGINVIPVSIESDQLEKKIRTGQYQAVLKRYNYHPSNDNIALRNFYSNELNNINGFQNFKNIRINLIIDRFTNAISENKTQKITNEYQKLIKRYSPCIFLFSKDIDIYAINPRFENFLSTKININGKTVNLFKPKHEWFVKKANQKY